MEIYPAFFTPRDEEPSLSSFEEKSSEFDWLERKRTRKQIYIYIYEKQSKCSVFYFFAKLYNRLIVENKLPRWFFKENYKLFIRGYSPFVLYLKTKESYYWWVTRRFRGFRQQISKEKYLQMSVANIWKLQENIATLCKMAAKLSGWALLEDPDMYIRRSWNAILFHPAPEFLI